MKILGKYEIVDADYTPQRFKAKAGDKIYNVMTKAKANNNLTGGIIP